MGNKGWRNTRQFLEEVLDLAHGLSPEGEFEVSIPDSVAIGMYWRCTRLFRATIVLLEDKLPEEALIIARSLYLESLFLMELSEAETEKESLELGWLNHSYIELRGLFLEAQRAKIDKDVSDVMTQIDKQQQNLQKYSKDHGVGKLLRFGNVSKLSIKFNRQEDYWIYLLSHQIVHSTDAANFYSRKKRGENEYAYYGQTGDINLIIEVGHYSARSLLMVVLAVSTIFDWQIPTKYYEMLEKAGKSHNR